MLVATLGVLGAAVLVGATVFGWIPACVQDVINVAAASHAHRLRIPVAFELGGVGLFGLAMRGADRYK